jgi:hypothetical protein
MQGDTDLTVVGDAGILDNGDAHAGFLAGAPLSARGLPGCKRKMRGLPLQSP